MKIKVPKYSDYNTRKAAMNTIEGIIMSKLCDDCYSRKEKHYVEQIQHEWIIDLKIRKKVKR